MRLPVRGPRPWVCPPPSRPAVALPVVGWVGWLGGSVARGVGRSRAGPVGHEDRGAGEQPAPQRAPLAPDALVPGRPLRLDQIAEHKTGRHQLTDPIAEGAVLF